MKFGFIKKLLASAGLMVGSTVIADQHEKNEQDLNILLVRLYLSGQVTLNGRGILVDELSEPFKDASTKGGAVWVYAENLDLEKMPNARKVLNELSKVNLPFLFSANEDFSDISATHDRQRISPTNLIFYQPEEEYEKYVVNEQETLIYLSNLELHLTTFCVEKNYRGKFHVVVALRPNESRVWLLHPEQYDDADFDPLMRNLKTQLLPAISGGIVAFALSMEYPDVSSKEQDFGIPVPSEWGEIIEHVSEEMPATKLLNLVWPPDSS